MANVSKMQCAVIAMKEAARAAGDKEECVHSCLKRALCGMRNLGQITVTPETVAVFVERRTRGLIGAAVCGDI
jgi:hypothetical protein